MRKNYVESDQMKKSIKIILGVMAVIILLAVVMMVSAVNQAKETREQVEDAKALVKYVETQHPDLTAEQQHAYENAKKLVEVDEAGQARIREADANAKKSAESIKNS